MCSEREINTHSAGPQTNLESNNLFITCRMLQSFLYCMKITDFRYQCFNMRLCETETAADVRGTCLYEKGDKRVGEAF